MTQTALDQLRYPIGKFNYLSPLTTEQLGEYVAIIEAFPARLDKEVSGLNDSQLDTPYRDGGWTLRQVVHHCADSHMNAFTRFKLAITEDRPTIKPYEEAHWAELPDAKLIPVRHSLILLEGLHSRWTLLLKSLDTEDLKKTFVHPEKGRELSLNETLALYAWHCRHHLAHITELKKRMNW